MTREGKSLEWHLPMVTVSELNMREHWSIKAKRAKTQKKMVWAAFQSNPDISLPCTVKLVRIGIRLLDSDNLQGAFKAIRDQVASHLIPGKSYGQADNDARIKWEYDQEKGKPTSIKIIIQQD